MGNRTETWMRVRLITSKQTYCYLVVHELLIQRSAIRRELLFFFFFFFGCSGGFANSSREDIAVGRHTKTFDAAVSVNASARDAE